MKNFSIRLFISFLMLGVIKGSMGLCYDQVIVNKVVPLVQKNNQFDVLRKSPNGQIWGLDRKRGAIYQINEDGKFGRVILGGKNIDAPFKSPLDFCFIEDRKILVSDSGLHQLSVVTISTNQAIRVGGFSVQNPGSLAIRKDHVIAVADTKKHLIRVYAQSGILLHSLSAPSENEFKSISALSLARDGTLWVLDGEAGSLHRFSSERKWLGQTSGLGEATGLDVDEFGVLIVSLRDGRWKEINSDGKVTGTFGTKGKKLGQMVEPGGVVYARSTEVWVADNGNARLQRFGIRNGLKTQELVYGPAARIHIADGKQFSGSYNAVFPLEGGALLSVDRKGRFQFGDLDGQKTLLIQKKKGRESLLIKPAYVAGINKDVWVSDQGDHKIKWIDLDGTVKSSIGQKGKKEGGLLSPSYLTIRPDYSFVVADRDNTRIQVLSKEGLFLFSVGPAARQKYFERIAGVSSNEFGFAVLDAELKTLFFFDHSGKLVSEIKNKPNAAPIWLDPCSLTTDYYGNTVVLDKLAGRLRLFSPYGKYLADVSIEGHYVVGSPEGLWIAGQDTVTQLKISVVPLGVQNFSLEEESGAIRLRWQAGLGASAYRIYRSSADQAWGFIAEVSSVTYVDSNIIPGQTYRYAVTGLTSLGIEGDWVFSLMQKAPKKTDTSVISISAVNFKPVFTAASKFYVDHEIGQIDITNNSDRLTRNIKISLALKNYTDFATEKVIESLAPGQTISAPMPLTLNDKVLELSENTPVQADVRISFFEDNVEKSVSQNVPLMLYSRYAISWNDKNRLASFITPKDPPIVEFSRAVLKEFLAPLKSATIGKPLAKAALLYEALNALSLSYIPDPKTPFSDVSEKLDAIDYVQFPRETLRRRTGDCDDTTALLASLLMSIGVDVALVDKPGHILLMVDTEESDPWVLGLPVERFVEFRGTYWVPIETTSLGKSFVDAWQAGNAEMRSTRSAEVFEKSSLQIIPVLEAHGVYPPVTLSEKEGQLVIPSIDVIKERFSQILSELQNERYNAQLTHIKNLMKQTPNDDMLKIQLGMVHFEGKKIDEAKLVFNGLLNSPQPQVQASAQNNLGNLAFLDSDYKLAQQFYVAAGALSDADAGILINRARCAWKLNEPDKAKQLLSEASKLSSSWSEFTTDFPSELLPK